MAVEIIDTLKAKNNGDFPIADANDIRGGWHCVETMNDLLNLSPSKKIEGMVVNVTSIDQKYTLQKGEWKLFKGGSSIAITDIVPSHEENEVWINPKGDSIELPLEPENPVVVELRNTIKAQSQRIDNLELVIRRIIDGGTYVNKPEVSIDNITTRAIIQVRRGNHADIPNNLEVGEFGLSLDTRDLYIGMGAGNLHVNPTKNISEHEIYLYSENNTKYKLSISDDGYMNITKVVEKEVIPPKIDKGYTVSISGSQSIGTSGDNIRIHVALENTSNIKPIKLNVYDDLLDNNLDVHITDVSNISLPKISSPKVLFNNNSENLITLMPKEKMTITYMLNINNKVNKNIIHRVLGAEHVINIIRG